MIHKGTNYANFFFFWKTSEIKEMDKKLALVPGGLSNEQILQLVHLKSVNNDKMFKTKLQQHLLEVMI